MKKFEAKWTLKGTYIALFIIWQPTMHVLTTSGVRFFKQRKSQVAYFATRCHQLPVLGIRGIMFSGGEIVWIWLILWGVHRTKYYPFRDRWVVIRRVVLTFLFPAKTKPVWLWNKTRFFLFYSLYHDYWVNRGLEKRNRCGFAPRCCMPSQHCWMKAAQNQKTKVYNTRYSQAVTHPSTNRARRCLTSVIGREPVFSTWYGRRHELQVICGT